MEWIIISVAIVVSLFTGGFLALLVFLLMLAQNGYAMKDGKIRPIHFTPTNLVVNFPEGMTEERAEEMLIEFAARIRGEPAGITLAELEQKIARQIERAMGAL